MVEALLLATGNEYNPSGFECPFCHNDVDVSESILKVKNRAKLSILKQSLATMQEIKEKIKNRIEDENEDFANLDWIDKEKACEIIDEIFAEYVSIEPPAVDGVKDA